MRMLTLILLTTMLAGCAAAPHKTRSASAASYAYPPMIIHHYDIEQSTATAGAKVLPASQTAGARHTVRSGETLWAISKLYGVDVDGLANANYINDSKMIEAGQVLIIPGAASVKAVTRTVNYIPGRSASFIWPVSGCIEASFGSKADKSVNKGIDIRALEGTSVIASRGGKVVYCDTHLKGFGQTVIIDHMDGFQTVYSYNSDILVKVGDTVQQRGLIAKVGSSGRAKEPMLHFEIRKNGEPQNPEFYLSRSR